MSNLGPAGLLAATMALAWAQPVAAADGSPARTSFKCQDGSSLTAQFASRGALFLAIVDAGDGPHALPWRPPTPGPVKITWSDGRRTLTWSPGVQIMWMDGATHLMCGRAEHRHEAPARPAGPIAAL